MGASINDRMDDESLLSYLYDCIEHGLVALRITRAFLDNGYDLNDNAGFNGIVCLEKLCWSAYDCLY